MSINNQYRILQAFFWALYCIIFGYISVYLLDQNFSSSEIGLVTAIFCTASAVIQPLLGRICDKNPAFGWKQMLMILSVVSVLFCLSVIGCQLLYPASKGVYAPKLLLGFLYGCCMICISAMMPFVNSASFYYEKSGAAINYGFARGMGSISYAVVSYILGRLAATIGVNIIPFLCIAVLVLNFLLVIRMPYSAQEAAAQARLLSNSSEEKGKKKQKPFLLRYPVFLLSLAGCVLLMSFHNITNTYLIQLFSAVGGSSDNMGVALAAAAILELPVMFTFSYLIKRFPAAGLIVFSGFAFVIKGICYIYAPNIMMLYISQITQMFSFAVYTAASVYYADMAVAPEDKTTSQSCITSVSVIGSVVGNLAGGLLIDLYSLHTMMITATVMAAVGTLIFALAVLLNHKRLQTQ